MKKTNLQLVKSQGQCHRAVRALGQECAYLRCRREGLVEEGLETWVESGPPPTGEDMRNGEDTSGWE